MEPTGSEQHVQLCSYHAPPAYSQLTHYYLYQLRSRTSLRSVAAALQLQGALDREALNTSFSEVVHRHDALRTRLVFCEGMLQQEVRKAIDCAIGEDDLSLAPGSHESSEAQRYIERCILEPVDVSQDALCDARLLRIRSNEHVLLVTLEHMISDIYSISVVLRELLDAYFQLIRGEALLLPPVSLQFSDYATRQKRAEPAAVNKHGTYWMRHIQHCPRVRFPEDQRVPLAEHPGWGFVSVQIGGKLKTALYEWSRRNRTTPAMSVFAAYAGVVLRWCGVSESIIRYQGNGRVTPDAADSVGFYASRLYLHISLAEEDRFVDLARLAMAAYCKAYVHDDFCYLETQEIPPECARNTFFNWIPLARTAGIFHSQQSDDRLSVYPQPFVNPWLQRIEWDNEPNILLYEKESEIAGAIRFPRDRFSLAIMERFRDNFLNFIRAMLDEQQIAVREVELL